MGQNNNKKVHTNNSLKQVKKKRIKWEKYEHAENPSGIKGRNKRHWKICYMVLSSTMKWLDDETGATNELNAQKSGSSYLKC